MNTCDTCGWLVKQTNPNFLRGIFCECPKICESGGDCAGDNDSLRYSFSEGGGFKPGPKFGCVHHKERIDCTVSLDVIQTTSATP